MQAPHERLRLFLLRVACFIFYHSFFKVVMQHHIPKISKLSSCYAALELQNPKISSLKPYIKHENSEY